MKRVLTLFIVLVSFAVSGQNRPFEREIRAFERADSMEMPPRKAIVFVGSSSFRLWKDVQQDFPGHLQSAPRD